MKFSYDKMYIDLEDNLTDDKIIIKATQEILEKILSMMNENSVLSSDDYGLYANREEIERSIRILQTLSEYDSCYIEDN